MLRPPRAAQVCTAGKWGWVLALAHLHGPEESAPMSSEPLGTGSSAPPPQFLSSPKSGGQSGCGESLTHFTNDAGTQRSGAGSLRLGQGRVSSLAPAEHPPGVTGSYLVPAACLGPTWATVLRCWFREGSASLCPLQVTPRGTRAPVTPTIWVASAARRGTDFRRWRGLACHRVLPTLHQCSSPRKGS